MQLGHLTCFFQAPNARPMSTCALNIGLAPQLSCLVEMNDYGRSNFDTSPPRSSMLS